MEANLRSINKIAREGSVIYIDYILKDEIRYDIRNDERLNTKYSLLLDVNPKRFIKTS